MRLHCILAIALLGVPATIAQGLPDLGDVSQSTFTPRQERQLGESIMREVRTDRSYYDDAEAVDYISEVGNRLVAKSGDARQDMEFFLIRDPQINAFALPGGFIGVHTGLILAAQSESELAGVMAHEIAHVTQRHISRMVAQQRQSNIATLASLAIAILASRASPDLAMAAAAFGQAGAIQSQLNFTRDNERDADRTGVQILDAAGYDPRGMVVFFERLQRATRIYEGGAPSYLRTHPLTFERIADVQNRIEQMPYRQVPDTLDFQLVRSKLKAELDPPRDAVAFFEESLAERRFLSEAASRYGLTIAVLRAKDLARARREFAVLRKLVPANPMVSTLGCRILVESGEWESALACYRQALTATPNHRALTYDYAEALLRHSQPAASLRLVEARLQDRPDDYRLYLLQARGYAATGRRLAQHRAQAEAYFRMGNVGGAIEQLQIGLSSGEGDFYQLSATEARLRQWRAIDEESRREAGRR